MYVYLKPMMLMNYKFCAFVNDQSPYPTTRAAFAKWDFVSQRSCTLLI